MLWDAVHARLGAADSRRRLFTLLVHSQTLVCAPDWKFKHATRILDVIMLQYPVKVRPMPGMWIQSIPGTQPSRGGVWTLGNVVHYLVASKRVNWMGNCQGRDGVNQVCKVWSEIGECEYKNFMMRIKSCWCEQNLHGVKTNLVGMNKTIFRCE